MKLKPKSILGLSIRAQIKDGLKGKRPWQGWDSCHSEEGRDGTEMKRSSVGSRETRATRRRRKGKDLKEEKCRRAGGEAFLPGPTCSFSN